MNHRRIDMHRLVFSTLGVLIIPFTWPRVPGWAAEMSHHATDLSRLVMLASAIGAVTLLSWATLLSVIAMIDLRVARRLGPAWLVTLAVGAIAAPAGAAEHAWDGLTPPDRPVSVERSHPSSPTPSRHTVVVGDSLWTIVADRLPADVDHGDVLRGVRRWHERNRMVIGPDPDLLMPGQTLTAPEA